jgi:hypothetical protein
MAPEAALKGKAPSACGTPVGTHVVEAKVVVAAAVVTELTNYTKLSKKIIHRSRRFSKLKPV